MKVFRVATALIAITLPSGCSEHPDDTQPLRAQRTLIEAPIAASTANPNASAAAKCLLDYFYQLPTRSDRRVVSGQYFEWPNPDPGYIREARELFEKTGHWVGLVGGEYITHEEHKHHHNPTLRPDRVNPRLKEYWNKGGLVALNVHFNNPQTAGPYNDTKINVFQLLRPGNPTYDKWLRDLDAVATGLRELQKAGVVVLWRPFHEMNGNWFWWGRKNPAAFKGLWRRMFDYFTYTKGINNLLWVYAPNSGSNVTDYYPGDTYVDIVGLDVYPRAESFKKASVRGYDEMIALGKPFAFTEVGPKNAFGSFDYESLISTIKQHYPETVYFLAWNAHWRIAHNRNAKVLLDHPWIVNRQDIRPPPTC